MSCLARAIRGLAGRLTARCERAVDGLGCRLPGRRQRRVKRHSLGEEVGIGHGRADGSSDVIRIWLDGECQSRHWRSRGSRGDLRGEGSRDWRGEFAELGTFKRHVGESDEVPVLSVVPLGEQVKAKLDVRTK